MIAYEAVTEKCHNLECVTLKNGAFASRDKRVKAQQRARIIYLTNTRLEGR